MKLSETLTTGTLSLKYATDANTAKALILMTLSASVVSLKLAMIAIATKYQLQMLWFLGEISNMLSI